MSKKILLTGASGCIGHYIAESLIQETNYELYFLVRNKDKIKFNYQYRDRINILEGDLLNLEKHQELLSTINVAILTATAWGDPEITYQTNVVKTLELLKLLNPENCEKVIYFSTASILGNDNKLLPEAGTIGTDYVKTKYQCFTSLKELKIYDKITTVFPTLVFGGDDNKPYSHLSSGLPEIVKYINLIRWFKADGSFHFIHGRDIAQVTTYLVDNDTKNRELVLGNEAITADETIKNISQYLGKTIYFQIPLSPNLANFFIKIFDIKMAEWDRFCLNYRHFTYQNYVNPKTFNLQSYCDNINELMEIHNIPSPPTPLPVGEGS
jgi:nucleoside-diphosphate-sugar epimerase